MTNFAPTLALAGAWALALVAWEPAVRTAAWGVLWLCHVGAGYPEPPAYTAWAVLP